MAFGAKKIFPIDQRPGVAVGLSLPFNAPSVFKSTYTTQESIKYNLINFFLTNTNERYLNPLFGGNLRAFIFEQITAGNLDFLKENISSQIFTYFKNVIVDDLQIFQDTDNNSINVVLTYSIKDTGNNDQIQLSFI